MTVKAADGGGPGKIIDAVCRRYSPRDFDQVFILMDEDVPISQNAYDKARKNNISVLSSTPYCLEGMLLDITGQPVGEDSRQCKKRLQEQLAGPPTAHESYARLLTRERLDGAGHPTIEGLRNALLGSSAF
ncbi:hypothetical protein [Ectothiorhodospira shaposhnikovii]|uniref:hypothetical protein n=1 Tax=Ectothiorhodospira shaposhnikovii TaxID=1054 RepID=UPI001EE7D5FB|nr:hypothetical protein [Ectothiorhodospira shaposhnikovii]MCG5514074.1 hypothetical protein [Ectothiorhodospira shaposhnikovii]